MNTILLVIVVLASFFLIFYGLYRTSGKKTAPQPLPANLREILEKEVDFYRQLDPAAKISFEGRVQHFLLHTKITGY